MNEKVGIYVNPAGHEQYRRQAVQVSQRLSNSVLHELTFPLAEIPVDEGLVIVAGGDGSVKGVMEAMLQRDNPGLLLIIPAGAQNGLFTGLKDEKATLTVDQVLDTETNHIPHFRPGNIEGELFVHLADVTKSGVLQIKYSEAMRKFTHPSLRKLRGYGGVAAAFVKIKKGEDYPSYGMKMLMPSPYIGSRKVYPDQKLHSDELTLVSLDAENKVEGAVKMTIVLLCIVGRRKPPKSVAEVRTQKSFEIETHSFDINADGELRTLPKKGTIFVARDKRSLQVAALVN
jgi:diacylglycerol kinase family enzyme